jgi:hypothetical protein
MTHRPPRQITARRWTGLLLATTAFGAGIAHAQIAPAVAATDETILLAQDEGGEGGEAGAVAGVNPETAYIVRLAIVEGHLRAAAALYEKGMVDDAIGLSYHPEAEMMDDVRRSLAAHKQADFTPSMQVFSATLESSAAISDVRMALAAFQSNVDAAIRASAPSPKMRFAVATAVLKAAAAEYAGSIDAGNVTDSLAYHEAQAFVDVAHAMIGGVSGDATLEQIAVRAQTAMALAAEAFGTANGRFVAKDPAILLGVAARVELISSQIR